MTASLNISSEFVADRDLPAASAEVAQLREALESRACIEQLKGMIMLITDCNAETAWALIVRQSQNDHVKVRDLAEQACASSSRRQAILASSLRVRRSLGD